MAHFTVSKTLLDEIADSDVIYYDFSRSQVILENQKGLIRHSCSSLHAFFKACTLYCGHSLAGQKEAYKTLMHARKFIPLLLSQDPLLFFLPVCTDGAWMYLNFSRLQFPCLNAEKNRSSLYFVDGLQIAGLMSGQVERNYLNAKWYLSKLYSSQSSQ
ncbi:MAG: hypothetical protein ACI32F_02660 [Allobaculum sp.]